MHGVLISDVSDHLPIFSGTLNCKSEESSCMNKEKYNLKREVNSVNVKNLVKRLGCVEWSEVYETVGVNEAYNKFINIFSNLYNNCCPIVKVKCRNNKDKPWITNGIRNASRKKNYLYKLFIKKQTHNSENRYKK